jgi:hypothetical protein
MPTPPFTLGMSVHHKELDLVGIVESEMPITVHIPNLLASFLNVRLGEVDNIWWDITKLEPVEPVKPTTTVG